MCTGNYRLNYYRNRFQTIIYIFLILLFVVSTNSCDVPSSLRDPFDVCDSPPKATVEDIAVFYGPFKEGGYAIESDTVTFSNFTFNLRLLPKTDINYTNSNSSGCPPLFNFHTVSNISILLNEEYNDLPIGTDISFLMKLSDGTYLNKLRDFSKSSEYYSLKIEAAPKSLSQLKTKTFLFLRDGSKIVFDSTSPYISN